jgi:hypothetical protein
VGYLRESYDGGPYATLILVPEALERDAEVSAGFLRARLPLVLLAAKERQMSNVHKKRIALVATLQSLGYAWTGLACN